MTDVDEEMLRWIEKNHRSHLEYSPRPQATAYREPSEAEIKLIELVKAKAEEVRELLEGVARHNDIDHRWLEIGLTDLQTGFMAVIRAIARPEGF